MLTILAIPSRCFGIPGLLLLILTGCSTVPHGPSSSDAVASSLQLPENGDWVWLFDGLSMEGWQTIQFGGEGEVQLNAGALMLDRGEPFTGVRFTRPVPVMNYEIELEAVRWQGVDFFCGLTVPVGESHCSLIVGGWGGSVLGISSLDGLDASENDAAQFLKFDEGRWYHLRMRVTEGKIEVWLDGEMVVNISTQHRRVALRPGMIEMSRPLGICSWKTKAGVRNVKVRKVIPGVT